MLDTRFDQQIFDWALKQDLEDLRLAVENEKDSKKQNVYAALYSFALAKKQAKLIAGKDFIG